MRKNDAARKERWLRGVLSARYRFSVWTEKSMKSAHCQQVYSHMTPPRAPASSPHTQRLAAIFNAVAQSCFQSVIVLKLVRSLSLQNSAFETGEALPEK